MIKKIRTKPLRLEILESLDTRMNLNEEDKQNYLYLKRGYAGEVMFDLLTNKLECECYILNDLLLKVNNTLFQIDTLMIFQKMILVFEVKNFIGDYLYEKDKLYTKAKFEVKDPLLQLLRCESLLRQLLQNSDFPFPSKVQLFLSTPNSPYTRHLWILQSFFLHNLIDT